MAASRFQYSSFTLFFLLSVFSALLLPVFADHNNGGKITIEKISIALSNAGYHAMSLTLDLALPALISFNSSSVVTIFAPPDQAFLHIKYCRSTRRPPLFLLKYHFAPMKLDRETLMSPAPPHGSKFDTFLPRHPLVVTTLPHSDTGSINGVAIKKWNIYNDGNIIVHGVADFFNPVYYYQTKLYPWFGDHHDMPSISSTAATTRTNSIIKDSSTQGPGSTGDRNWFVSWW